MKEFLAQRNICLGVIEIYLLDRRGNQTAIAEPLTFNTLTDEGVQPPPLLNIDRTEAQVLMDSLWDCGIRPTEGAGSAGAMSATQKHLEDMRSIAFNALQLEKK